MPVLLFELGAEEMPANALPSALEQLKKAMTRLLADARLSAALVEVFGTPRRLILMAHDIPARQADVEREVKGPARAVAYDAEGNPAGPAIGFAKKQGIEPSALQQRDGPKGKIYFAKVTVKGAVLDVTLAAAIAVPPSGLCACQ